LVRRESLCEPTDKVSGGCGIGVAAFNVEKQVNAQFGTFVHAVSERLEDPLSLIHRIPSD
jgi:hypothetical protein